MIGDELTHIIKNLSAQSSIEQRPWVYGHISTYNPADNSARVIVPSMRDDVTGAPLHSGWLPMGSAQVGGGAGLQVAPIGGATADAPTLGEACLVALNERGSGVAAIVCTFFTGLQQPPNSTLPQGAPLKPGELMIRHKSGSVLRFHDSGDLEVVTGGDGTVSVTTGGDGAVNVTCSGSGTITLKSAQPMVVDGDLHVKGAVIGGFGSNDQVSLQTHKHGVGSPAAGTSVPTAGT